MLTDLILRLRALVARDAVEREIDVELQFHFDHQIEKYQRAGLTRAEAERRARVEFPRDVRRCRTTSWPKKIKPGASR